MTMRQILQRLFPQVFPNFAMRNGINLIICFVICTLLTSCAGKTPTSTVTGTKPYTVKGKKYYPLQNAHGFVEEGEASWYGPGFHGNTTANGETYNQYALTAAHKLLPLGTTIHVTNLENGKSVTLRVNDRGPFSGDRVLDVSKKAAEKLDMIQSGTAHVRIVSINTQAPDNPTLAPSTANTRPESAGAVLAPIVEEIMADDPVMQQRYTQAQQVYAHVETVEKTFSNNYEENFNPQEYVQEYVEEYAEGYVAQHTQAHNTSAYPNGVTGTFYIQVGNFETKKFAYLLVLKLQDAGMEARTQKNAEGNWHVLAGPFTESHIAQQKLSELSQQFENVKIIQGEP